MFYFGIEEVKAKLFEAVGPGCLAITHPLDLPVEISRLTEAQLRQGVVVFSTTTPFIQGIQVTDGGGGKGWFSLQGRVYRSAK